MLVVKDVFDGVELALAEAQERLAGLTSARANQEAATAALIEVTGTLGGLASRIYEVVERQMTFQVELERRANELLETAAKGLDTLVVSRLEERIEHLTSVVQSTSNGANAMDEKLSVFSEQVVARLTAQDEALQVMLKKTNAHVTTKVGLVLENVQSYGEQIYELTAQLYNGLVFEHEAEAETAGDDMATANGARTVLPADERAPEQKGRLFRRTRH